MTFEKAFEFVKQDSGNYMRLPHWGSDVKIRVWSPWPIEQDDKREMTAPFLYVESRFGRVPWKETMVELFSDAWGVGQEESKAVLREEIK